MKIKDWIILGLLFLSITAVPCLSAEMPHETSAELLDQLEQATQIVSEDVKGKPTPWKPLEDFQSMMYRAMALDPSPIAFVPPAQVPAHLFSVELNQELARKFEELKKSPVPQNAHAEAEFNRYLEVAQRVLDFRKGRQFPQARAIAKRGVLETTYEALSRKISNAKLASTPGTENSFQSNRIKFLIQGLKTQMSAQIKDNTKKDLFTNGNHFAWYGLVAMMGFIFGIFGYRLNPDFFQKILNHTQSMVPEAAGPKFDYLHWLKDLEEILSRLKSSQLTHERRIEDVVQNSEKITQQALALYADARIKSESNLEYRMSALLKEIQTQCEQGKRLQASDRIQINLMLEHCLRLCDAIENNSIHYEQNPPYTHQKSAS